MSCAEAALPVGARWCAWEGSEESSGSQSVLAGRGFFGRHTGTANGAE